jgi:chromosome partitioning protein
MGKRVLLVDLDLPANATLAVGIDPTTLPKNINHLFTRIDTAPDEVVTQTTFGLSILPSHPDLVLTESGMKATQVGMLRGLLAPLENSYEVIVLDTPHQKATLR